MKKIKINHNKEVTVDKKDFDWLNQWKWRWDGQRATRTIVDKDGTQHSVKMHRLIMGSPKGMVVDHINGDTLDNRRSNLRVCTSQQNSFNARAQTGTSKYKGVSKNSRCPGKPWYAYIRHNYKSINLGNHQNEKTAAMAYNRKAKELFGDYARLNQV